MAHFIYTQAENILTKLKDCPIYQKRIEYTMLSLKAILMDAEGKQEHNQYLHNWLKELQNVFYQIEDSIDEFKWELFKQGDTGKQVRAHFSCSDRISANKSKQTRKMKKLCDHLDAIAVRMYEFHLNEKHTASISMETTHSFLSATEISIRHMKPSWQLLYPLTDAPRVYHGGRYNDLLNDFNKSTHGFYHIVGEAGMGKSTLAKFLYNDEEVVDKYTSRYWVCVKEGYDTQRLLKEVYNYADNKETGDDLTVKQLLSKVQRFLRDRTFLLVFQDLSTTNLGGDASTLKKLLEMGNHGSKIIVTTQSEEVANAIGLEKVYETEKQSKQNLVIDDGESVGNWSLPKDIQSQAVQGPHQIEPTNINNDLESHPASPLNEIDADNVTHQTIFKLERLSEQNSLLLFKDYAFKDRQEAENPDLTKIVKQIVQKCNGVPLAIKCLGRMLSSKTKIAEWENVKGKLCTQEEKDDSVLSTLRLCYNQMPSQLKPCFLHCSQLLDECIFSSNDMIQLWMAHGLLHSTEENNLSMENLGEKYFMELWSRCFIQEIEEHGLGYWVKLHPLIQKLAHVLTQEQSEGSAGTKQVNEIRSIAFQVRNMVLPSASITEKCISKYKCLRLLYLCNTNLQEIPNSIGTLKNLRYLDLHGNKEIKKLPNSICDLQSLQTLILESCSALEELPKDIRNLISLRNLWVTANKLHLHKNGVGTMSSLRFLAIGGCNNLKNLFEQPDCLAGLETLIIYDCNTLTLLPNEMRFLKSLQNLMIWSCKKLTLTLNEVEFRLQRFTIKELPKVEELPGWLEGSSETLRSLQIINCPVSMEEKRFEMFKAVERTIIYGAVRFEMAVPGYGFEHRNLAMRGATAGEKKITYY